MAYITVFANGNCEYKQSINNGNKSETQGEQRERERAGRKKSQLPACLPAYIVKQSPSAVCAQVLSEMHAK